MNADLEAQLEEMGPEYRAVVSRLRSARTVSPRAPGLKRMDMDERGGFARKLGYLLAASLFLAICFALFLERRPVARELGTVYTIAYAPTEEALGIILASQRADGSWDNDFITRQNAAALRNVSDAKTQVAYRRAVRYLKSKGLAPLTDAELKSRGEFAVKSLHADV